MAPIKETISLVTGGFDPVHAGHIDYIRSAINQGAPVLMEHRVAVGLNSDAWLKRKKGYVFMSFEERKYILENIKGVDLVFGFNDEDNTASAAIQTLLDFYPGALIYFCNGGDRTDRNTPEEDRFPYDEYGNFVQFRYAIGGGKRQSSSALVDALKNKWTVNVSDPYVRDTILSNEAMRDQGMGC